MVKKSTTKKSKEPAEIDEDGFIIVTRKKQPEDHNNRYNHSRQQEVNQLCNMESYQAMKMTRRKRLKVMKMKKVRAKKKTITRRKHQKQNNPD
jgi:Ribosomal RNA-processing protein 7 (RRP7) C-terminal domain